MKVESLWRFFQPLQNTAISASPHKTLRVLSGRPQPAARKMSGMRSKRSAHPSGPPEEGCPLLLRMQSRAESASIPLIQMRPANERELAIARTVDKIAIEGRLDLAAIDDVCRPWFPRDPQIRQRVPGTLHRWRMETRSSSSGPALSPQGLPVLDRKSASVLWEMTLNRTASRGMASPGGFEPPLPP